MNVGTTEPLIGTAIGLMVGVGSPPGIFTYIGGAVLLGSTVSPFFADRTFILALEVVHWTASSGNMGAH